MGMKRKFAAAVNYRTGDAAPKLLLKGHGLTAERMLQLAEEYGIYIHEDDDLASILELLDIGSCIPEAVYESFALILARLYKLNDQKRSQDR